MVRRIWAALMIVVFVLGMSGCSAMAIDVETQLRTPHGEGEQDAVQSALEEYIYAVSDLSATGNAYVLKYPKMGDYRSSFVMKDINNDGQDEAIAFYALQPEGANTHITLLQKSDGVWSCIDDIEGLSADIERVAFGDLDGDKVLELFTGFSMYNTRDRKLMLYTLQNNHFVERYNETYTNIIVSDITDSGHDDLLLFRVNTAEQTTTVRLLSMRGDTIIERGAASLDGQIQQFGGFKTCSLGDHVQGVFQDCTKDAATTITELIVWDGKQLTAPFYNPTENITTLSARESGYPSMDIDNDGQIEWPKSFRLPGNETTETEKIELWLTDWYAWDFEKVIQKKKLTNVLNQKDGYYLTVPEEWNGNITASYNKDSRVMTVRQVEKGVIGKSFIKIRTTVAGQTESVSPDDEDYIFLASKGTTQYEIWYDKTSSLKPTMEQLRELFVVCTVE